MLGTCPLPTTLVELCGSILSETGRLASSLLALDSLANDEVIQSRVQMDIFVYEPIDLERPAFRLLQLLRGKGPAIECVLYQAYLDGADTIPYDALSYTWGGTDKISTVKVNGKTFNVTENLHSALQHLRSEGTDRVLWVDAICIDQGNERERGHQVEQMCKIYSQAEEVIVWLGQATEETNILMESLRRLEEYSSMHGHRHWDRAQWTTFWLLVPHNPGLELGEGLDLLLRKPWFRRVWILQEIANAKKASVWCGTKSVRARTFAIAPSLIGIKPERHCQAVLDIMPGHLREETWWSENRDLYNLLLKFSESEASDPRDKVYALLGISSDARNNNNLRPDYTKSLQKMIYDTSLFLFGPSCISYETMSELLENLTSQNVASFLKLVKTSDVSEVERFLKRRGLEVPLSEDMIKGAVANERSGRDIMSLLLQKRRSEVKVTEEVVRGAEANSRSGRAIINLLLQECESGFKVTEKVLNLLCEASERGHKAVVKLLLEKGADFNVEGEQYDNVLYVASAEGHETVVKLLLDKGANVNAQGGEYGNSLQAASIRGHEEVVKTLLDKGADVNAQDGLFGNALYAASWGGHEQVVKTLLDKGADVNAQDGLFGNALHAASLRGHEQIVTTLLNAGAYPLSAGLDLTKTRMDVAISKLSNIPYNTKWHRANGLQSKQDKAMSQRYLTPLEEEALVRWLVHMSHNEFPLLKKYICPLAHSIARRRSSEFRTSVTNDTIRPPGKNWQQGLFKRYPGLEASVHSRQQSIQSEAQNQPLTLQGKSQRWEQSIETILSL
jgi:ankyrin repeat protein